MFAKNSNMSRSWVCTVTCKYVQGIHNRYHSVSGRAVCYFVALSHYFIILKKSVDYYFFFIYSRQNMFNEMNDMIYQKQNNNYFDANCVKNHTYYILLFLIKCFLVPIEDSFHPIFQPKHSE